MSANTQNLIKDYLLKQNIRILSDEKTFRLLEKCIGRKKFRRQMKNKDFGEVVKDPKPFNLIQCLETSYNIRVGLLECVINIIDSSDVPQNDALIVDAGGGTGIDVTLLAQLYPNHNFIYYEPDRKYFNFAFKKVKRAGLENVTLIQTDHENCGMIDDKVDYIYTDGSIPSDCYHNPDEAFNGTISLANGYKDIVPIIKIMKHQGIFILGGMKDKNHRDLSDKLIEQGLTFVETTVVPVLIELPDFYCHKYVLDQS